MGEIPRRIAQDLAEGLVGGRTVEAGHRDIQQAQVDGQLAAMVDEVIEKHGAVEQHTRGVDNHAVAKGELPVGVEESSEAEARWLRAAAEERSSSVSR